MAKSFSDALRNLLRARAFTALVVLTLALGIGATTAMFSVVDATLLRRPPFPGIERFAEIRMAQPGPFRSAGIPGTALPIVRAGLIEVAGVEGYQMGAATITGGREPTIVASPSITPNLLSFIGATAQLGRLFNEDDLPSNTRNVVISDRLWSTSFGAAPDIVGRTIDIDDAPHTVIGVMGPEVRFPEVTAAIWRPLDLGKAAQSRMRVQVVTVRSPEVTADEFNARLKLVEQSLRDARQLTEVQTLEADVLTQERIAHSNGRSFWLMFGAVCLVLLVGCVNVSNLMLTRASRHHGDIALRAALGASRRQLLGQSLAESLTLGITGGLLGVGVAHLLLTIFVRILPAQLTFQTVTVSQIDVRVLLFASAVSLITAIAAGLLPAVHTSQADPIDAIKQHSSAVIGRNERWQSILLVGQLSLVLVLLSGAGLLFRSFTAMQSVDPGFPSDGLTLIQMSITSPRYAIAEAGELLMRDLEQRLESSGQMAVTLATGAPVFGIGVYGNIQPEADGGIRRDFSGQILPRIEVAPDYFSTVGIPIEQGRPFSVQDRDDVVVINNKMASYFWGDASPIGRRFRTDTKEPWRTVIGVVGDVKQMGLNDPLSHGMEMYLSNRSRLGAAGAILVRSDRPAAEVINAVKQTLWSIDPRIPIIEAMSMNDRIGESLYRQRFFLRLSTAFTVIATLLTTIGVFGVSAYWVSRRRRELAIRIALGASAENVIGLVIRRGLELAAIGAGLGVAIALAGVRVIESMLFQVSARDPLTLASATLLLATLVVIGCVGPALRASRVDPSATLRAE